MGPTRLVRSVPGELSTDGNDVLGLAQAAGHVSQHQVCQVHAFSPLSEWAARRIAVTLWRI